MNFHDDCLHGYQAVLIQLDIVFVIGSGVISGLIASGIIFIFNMKIKPNVDISEEICFDAVRNIYAIKVVNHSRFNAINLDYSLHKCIPNGDGTIDFNTVPTAKEKLTFLEKHSNDDHDAKYAIRIGFEPELFKQSSSESEYYAFRISARHALSGIISTFSKTYTRKDIVEGMFETRSSMRILKTR